jgi:hypothetical protein
MSTNELQREWTAHRHRIEEDQSATISKTLLMPLLEAAYRSGREPEWSDWSWSEIHPILERQLPHSPMVRKAVKEVIRAAYRAEVFATRLEHDPRRTQ